MGVRCADLIRDKRVIVCAGSGGVGKTTTSTALTQDEHSLHTSLAQSLPDRPLFEPRHVGLPNLDSARAHDRAAARGCGARVPTVPRATERRRGASSPRANGLRH